MLLNIQRALLMRDSYPHMELEFRTTKSKVDLQLQNVEKLRESYRSKKRTNHRLLRNCTRRKGMPGAGTLRPGRSTWLVEWRKNLIPQLHVQCNKAERQSLSFDTTYRVRETPKIYNCIRFENQGSRQGMTDHRARGWRRKSRQEVDLRIRVWEQTQKVSRPFIAH